MIKLSLCDDEEKNNSNRSIGTKSSNEDLFDRYCLILLSISHRFFVLKPRSHRFFVLKPRSETSIVSF